MERTGGFRADRPGRDGSELILNMNDHGYPVVVYNRRSRRWTSSSATRRGRDYPWRRTLRGALRRALKRPRKVMLMVKAGMPSTR